jgi:DNA-binding transcriptional ArsR family regulator
MLMIELVLAHSDLARVRFAHSPVRELVASLLALQNRTHQVMHGSWLATVRPRLGELRLELLTALVPVGRYLPAFLLPPVAGPWPALADELEVVATSHPAVVRAELEGVYQDQPLPTVLQPLYEDPAAHLPAIAGELQRYWRVAIQPVWQRVRAVCAADLTYRQEQFAAGGLARVLADLHSELTLEADRLRVDKPHHCHQRFDLAGTGILVVPCAFIWPSLMVECCGVDQPAVTYPARGVAELWEEPPAEHADPLIALVGRTRATLLTALGLPRTTTQLAAQLGLSPPAVSQHLKVLKDAALVSGRRRGRMVLYQRTPAASTLLTAIRSHEEAG